LEATLLIKTVEQNKEENDDRDVHVALRQKSKHEQASSIVLCDLSPISLDAPV